MDGLNCNEIQYSELFPNNTIFRLDAEFFSREAITIDKKIKEISCFYLKPQEVVSGPFGSSLKSESYLEQGDVPFVRIENIRGGFDINMDNIIYISNADNARIKNSQLSINDIVLSKVGNSIGFFARVDESIGLCNISENNIGIKLSTYSEEEKHYILTYLNSFYAQKLVLRRTSGNAQPKLNVGDLCYIPIPSFSDNFYKNISLLVVNSRKLNLKSKQIYCDTEKQLMVVLKIDDLNNKHENINIKSLVESFGCGGRLDAEYYQPIYENIEKQIDSTNTIIASCENRDENFTPNENEFYQYIELANVDSMGGISTVDKIQGKELPSRARRLVKTGQVIISSVEGSLQSCALITEEFNNAVCSTGFYVIDSEKYNSETLLVLFKSEPVQALLKKRCSGTILTAISKEEFEKMPLPEVDEIAQNAIKEKVQESFRLRKKSKELLDTAIKAVEMAIETDEQTALAWLGTQNV